MSMKHLQVGVVRLHRVVSPQTLMIAQCHRPLNFFWRCAPPCASRASSSLVSLLQPSDFWRCAPKRQMSSLPVEREDQIDTYAVMQALVEAGFTVSQAKILTRYMCEKVHQTSKAHRKSLLLRSQFDNESYLYQAALQDLRSELTTERKTDATALSLRIASCFREVDRLKQNFVESIHQLRSDAQLELNGRKQEVSEDRRRDEMKVQEIQNGITVGISDLKTEIEMMKLNLIWRQASFAAAAVLLVTLLGAQLLATKANPLDTEKEKTDLPVEDPLLS